MNILILGNGFDLAHGLKTSYEDFLDFLHKAGIYSRVYTNKESVPDIFFGENVDNLKIYLHVSEYLRSNIWYQYFYNIRKSNQLIGITWIDFEKEILHIIKYFDNAFSDLNEKSKVFFGSSNGNTDDKIKMFISIAKDYIPAYTSLSKFIDESYEDLDRLIRCLNIYLRDFVEREPITLYSPDIDAINPQCVLSFNYTHTFSKFYDKTVKHYHFIHGETNKESDDNNFVLGVNEYWNDKDKDANTNFNLYKKFVQRILKSTGVDYKKWLDNINKHPLLGINEDASSYGYYNHAFIFGHSLDVTDKDVLRDIILNEKICTIIFYKDKVQQATQIANLSKILGQDILLQKINCARPSIIFKKQQDMIERD